MLLKNVRKISLLVAISTVLTSFSVNAASLEEPTATSKFGAAFCVEDYASKANNLIDETTIPIGHHGIPIDEYTDENGNNIVVYNQFKLIQKPGDKYGSVVFNKDLTSISRAIDPEMNIDFFDIVGDVVIPNSVTIISSDALGNFGQQARENEELEKYPCTLQLSNSLTEITDNMCGGSIFTGTLKIPNSVKKIGYDPFAGARFDTVIVPKSVESMKPEALCFGIGWVDAFFEGNFLDDYPNNIFGGHFGDAKTKVHYPKGATGFDRVKKYYADDAILIPYEGTLEEALAEHEEQKRKDEEARKSGIYSDTVSVNGYEISFSAHCIYTGKKIKLDTITVSGPNGKVFSDKQVKVRYKNNKNASRVNKDQASATFMITGVKGDKEANKEIKAALKKQWVTYTIHPRDLSNEKLILSWKKNGDMRKVCYTLNGKKKTVPKKMWDYFEILKFSQNYTGKRSLSSNDWN